MDMDQAAVWLSGSILTMLGFIVVAGGIIIINNLLHKYWKPVTILSKESLSSFGFNDHTNSPLNVTDEEYSKLVTYLDELRNPPKVEPGLETKNGKSK